ncbi:MAG: TonB-dependent receptor [Rhizorhabdus sp.]
MKSKSMELKTILLVSTMLLPPALALPGQAGAQTQPAAQTPNPVPAAPAAATADAPSEQQASQQNAEGATAEGEKAEDEKADAAATAATAGKASDNAKPVRRRRSAETSDDGSILVTGSRLGGYDPTSDVKVFTQDDIKALGVSNVQDFIRSLPQNQASVGYGINNRRKTEVKFEGEGLGGLGVAGVNLRGLGTGNTLVLVNGRRIAGAAGVVEGFANINTIPLAAVERVEVSLGGGSAVYGADAMAGVINFILKKHYNGYAATVRREASSTGADTRQATYMAAKSWGTGSATATLSLTQTDPAENAKLGYVTHDYRNYFTREQLAAIGQTNFPLDMRSSQEGAQPGAITLAYRIPAANGQPGRSVFDVYQWVPGGDMTRPTFAGLAPINRDTIAPNIPVDAGEYQRTGGLSLNVEQKVTDRLHVTLDYLGSIGTSNLRELWQAINMVAVPFTQAYSPVKRSDLPAAANINNYTVYYYPAAQYADGSLPRGYQRSTIRSHTVNGGLRYDVAKDMVVAANYSYSRNTATGMTRGLKNVTKIDRFTSKCGANPEILGVADIDRIAAAQCAAITSSDPTKAFNFLDDGSSKLGVPANVFFLTTNRLANAATQRNADVLLTAAPVVLPAGKVRLAIGGETRSNAVTGEEIRKQAGFDLNNRLWAGYAELRVPLISEPMDVPLIHTFDVSLKGRYDRYDSYGAIGTVDNVPFLEGGKPIRGKSTFARFSPDIGIAWTPLPGLLLKGSWSSNFTPPPFTALYDVKAGAPFDVFLWHDPLVSDDTYLGEQVIEGQYQANPELRPSVSSSYHFGGILTPPGALHNLNVQVDYYRTRIRDRVGTSLELVALMPEKDYYSLTEYFIRDANNHIIRNIIKPINIGMDESQSVDVQVSYAIPTSVGLITPSVFYTRNLRQRTSFAVGSREISRLGTAEGLDKYRIIGNLDFTRRDFMTRLTVRYTPPYGNTYGLAFDEGEYQDSDNDGVKDRPMPIHSLTTYDLTTRWQANDQLTFSAGGRNIFNAKPPFALIDRRPFDASRYDLRGRVLYAEARVTF